ncbi:MAG TPA: hypothetical protein VM345_07055 [Acidimicrobiales bacterium]|nr:hypothetical protein [Acidimicrobiales bacterium]
MTHMVIYRSAEGQPVYHQTESLEEAARHLEHLRNAGQGTDARIFSMQEIPVEVKTYYKVEVPAEPKAAAPAAPAPAPAATPAAPAAPAAQPQPAAAPASPAPAAAAAPASPVAPQPVKGEPAAAGAGAGANGGRFGLFGKS